MKERILRAFAVFEVTLRVVVAIMGLVIFAGITHQSLFAARAEGPQTAEELARESKCPLLCSQAAESCLEGVRAKNPPIPQRPGEPAIPGSGGAVPTLTCMQAKSLCEFGCSKGASTR
jgi:hypothetical protein